MNRLIALAFLCALFLGTAEPAHSQAIVVTTCGTLPAAIGGTRTAGTRSDTFIDVNGQLCTNATGGSGGAATIADGADVAEGALADAAASVGGAGSISAKLRRITTQLDTISTAVQGSIPAGTATIGNVGSATGAAAPASAAYLGANGSGATGGLLAGLKTCDLHAKYDASDNGSITLVTGVSGRKVYICGYMLATGGTATNLKLREGSDANCATNGADLTPAWQLVANDKIGATSAFWTGLVVSTNAYYVCVNASAGNAHQAEIWYTIQ